METSRPLSPSPVTELAEDRHWWFATRTWAIQAWLQQAVSAGRTLDILDIGCGAGNMIHHLSEFGRVKGIEVDPRPVKMAQARGYDVRQGDATRSIPFPDNSFDLVTALDVIEHVDADEAILCEARRVLRPGGLLLVTTPAFQWLWSHNDEINAHKRRYTAAQLTERVEKAGLRVRRVSYNFFLVFPLAAGMILLRKGMGQKPELRSHHLQEDEYQVEMEPVSPLLNGVLRGVGQAETALIRRVNLPVGTSLLCMAEREG